MCALITVTLNSRRGSLQFDLRTLPSRSRLQFQFGVREPLGGPAAPAWSPLDTRLPIKVASAKARGCGVGEAEKLTCLVCVRNLKPRSRAMKFAREQLHGSGAASACSATHSLTGRGVLRAGAGAGAVPNPRVMAPTKRGAAAKKAPKAPKAQQTFMFPYQVCARRLLRLCRERAQTRPAVASCPSLSGPPTHTATAPVVSSLTRPPAGPPRRAIHGPRGR